MDDRDKLNFLIEKLEQVLPKIIKDLGSEDRSNTNRIYVDVDLDKLNMALIQLDTILGFINRIKILPEKSALLSPKDEAWAKSVADKYAMEVASGTLEAVQPMTKTCQKHGKVSMHHDCTLPEPHSPFDPPDSDD